jgi:GNAT superfamily N-acetyltransferase
VPSSAPSDRSRPAPAGVVLRGAVLEDGPAVAAVHRAALRSRLPWLPELHTPDEDRAFFTGCLQRLDAWVAERDGEVVGFAAVDHDAAMLDHLYLRPSEYRRGTGSALLDRARRAHDGPLRLWCFQRNAEALAFYAAHGARELERTDGRGNEEREPDVRLELPPWDGGREEVPVRGPSGQPDSDA